MEKNYKKNSDIINEDSWEKTTYGFLYKNDNIKFLKLSSRESLSDIIRLIELLDKNEKFGIFCSSLKESDLSILREKKISYYIPGNEIKIFTDSGQSYTKDASKNILHSKLPQSTLLVSPSGLEIVDTILKLNTEESKQTPTQISLKYALSRSKMSNIMRALRSRTIIEFKESLLDFELPCWIEMFNNPLTMRKMTPFKSKHTKRYILNDKFSLSSLREKISQLKRKKIEVEIAGLSYLKNIGRLRASEYDLIAKKDHIMKVVNALNLRPAQKGEKEGIIYITPLIGDLNGEHLYTKIANESNVFAKEIRELNPLRYLWGLNYHEERVQEERKSLLETYFNEARKKNNQ